MARKKARKVGKRKGRSGYPIAHWSHSSLMAYLRNPLAWYKHYVAKIYDNPSSPASIIGRAGHLALEHFYQGASKERAIEIGLAYIRGIPDFEVNFGVAKTRAAQKKKRAQIEKEYVQVIGFYLERPPRHKVLGAEVVAMAQVPGLPLPLKAVSDLVVESKVAPGALDIVDHKFVDAFSPKGKDKTLFVMQAIFNYYTISAEYQRPVEQFILYECRKRKNKDGSKQLRKYVIRYKDCEREFETFNRLVREASEDIRHRKVFLPNPSDMFEGEDSFALYHMEIL